MYKEKYIYMDGNTVREPDRKREERVRRTEDSEGDRKRERER